MTAPTVAVTCSAAQQGGPAIAGVVFTAKLNMTETFNGFVVPESATATTNAAGTAVLNLFPNALGTAGSLYTIKAVDPASGKRFLNTTFAVPNSACNLHEILVQEPYPALDAAAQALIGAQGALAAVTSQTGIATDRAAAAAASALSALASQTGASSSQSAASGSQTAASSSANSATNSATNAATSASGATASAINAATSASGATASATNAATSASGASTSATNSATSAANASNSATAAATAATNSANSATASAASATAASGSQTAAGTSASGAATSAINAANSAASASSSATTAATQAVNAAASFDSFDDRYLGAKATAPTLDNDGDALLVGALYFNSTSNALFSRSSGGTWISSIATTAGVVANTPAGGIAAITVQAALNELDVEKANIASPTFTGTVSGITALMVGAPSGSGASTGTNTGDQTAASLGLGNVNNTSDASKPVSTAQASALALKTDAGSIQAQSATAVTTVGSSTAYVVATLPVQPSLVAGQRYRIKLHTPNGASPTLVRDGLAATPFRVYNSSGAKVAPAAGALPTLFDVEYDGVDYVVYNQLPPTDLSYTGTLTGGTGVVNLGSGQVFKDASGNVGIGTSTPTEKLHVTGNILATGNITAFSDERLKTDWAALPVDFVEQLAQVKHGTYTRTDSGDRQVGVSAQSLQRLLPEAVLDGEYLSVAYGNAALAACVALAQCVIDLQTRLAALEVK